MELRESHMCTTKSTAYGAEGVTVRLSLLTTVNEGSHTSTTKSTLHMELRASHTRTIESTVHGAKRESHTYD